MLWIHFYYGTPWAFHNNYSGFEEALLCSEFMIINVLSCENMFSM